MPTSSDVADRQRPNIIVCMCDELRWSEVGCYGHPTIRTPHIDALAGRGVRFDTAVSNAPVCMPARSLLLAGQYARTCTGTSTNVGWPARGDGPAAINAGFPQWPTARRRHFPDPTLPEQLRDAGYRTHAIGKWHIEAWPDAIGFDHYVIPAHHHTHSAQWFCEDGGGVFSPPGFSVDYEIDRVTGLLTDHATDGAADQPLFLYYNISPPHMPLADAPEHYLKMYSRDDVVRRENIPDGFEPEIERILTYLWDYRHYRDRLPYACRLPWEGFDLTDLTAWYMGLVTWVDDTVGKLTRCLEAQGLAEDTLVIFTSDHGENIGSHRRMGKGGLIQESYRVPMVAAGPGVKQHAVSDRVASLLDLAPTCLEAAGEAQPDHMHGRSLGGALRGESADPDTNHAIIEAVHDGVGIRTPDVMVGSGHPPRDNAGRFEIDRVYDQRHDPFERDNLAGTADAPDEVAALAERLRAWDRDTPWLNESRSQA